MLLTKPFALFASVVTLMCAVPATAAADGTIRQAGGGAYTGPIHAILSSSNATLTTASPAGTITCTSAAGSVPALGSFGWGSITTSAITNSDAIKGSLIAVKFGDPLGTVGGGVLHNTTTVSNACPSTIPQLNPCTTTIGTTNINAVTNAATGDTGAFLRVNTIANISCDASGGGKANCDYQTYASSPGTPSAISSDLVPYSSSGPATVKFTNVNVYKKSGSSSLCPSTGKFNASYQLYTGQTYPGGNPIYVSKP